MRKTAFALAILVAATVFPASSRNRSYVFMRGGTSIISGGPLELNAVVAKRDQYQRNFLWVRTAAGREYLIRDEATLAQIERLFAPARASDPEMERLRERMHPLERREEALDRQVDALTDRDEDDAPLTRAEQQRLREMQRELRDVQTRLREQEREEEALDRKRDALEEKAEQQLWPLVEEAVRKGVAR
jgi:predicted RNase H-like nuclease (RuvC/YqgF family)